MEYFSKNKILGWIIIIGLAINIAAISTILYKVNSQRNMNECQRPLNKNSHEFISKELNLNSEQEQKFKEIRDASKEEAKAIFIKMRQQRTNLFSFLNEKKPDSIKINQLVAEIENSQSLLLHHTINHYLKLKNVLNEEQYQKLNYLFMDMFGCDRKSNCKSYDKDENCGENCKEKGNGGGGGKRHRHGQEDEEYKKGF